MSSNGEVGRSRRQDQYKSGGSRTSEDMRRKRQEHSVEIRKKKVEDQLMKRRNINDDLDVSPGHTKNSAEPFLMSLEEVQQKLNTNDPDEVYHAVASGRKLLSSQKNPPIKEFIACGLVPKFVKLLDSDDGSIQFEAAWALTNVASGSSEETKIVVESGAVPGLIRLLSSTLASVAEQAVWALGNIAGDGPTCRDLLIASGMIPPTLKLIRSDTPTLFLRNIAWTLSNLCRNKNPAPPFEAVQECLPSLAMFLYHDDREVVADACWALSYITDGPNTKIEAVVQIGVVERLVELMQNPEPSIATPALRTCGNIVTGNDSQTDAVLSAGGLLVAKGLLSHPKQSVVKEAAWLISNVTAGNQQQVQLVVEAGILPILVHVVLEGEFRAKKEAAWALTNLTSGGTAAHMVELCRAGGINALCSLLDADDARMVLVVLDGLSNLLRTADKEGKADEICLVIEECGGLDKIEVLQQHENEDVYKKAFEIVRSFFSEDSVGDGDGTPDVSEGTANGEFKF